MSRLIIFAAILLAMASVGQSAHTASAVGPDFGDGSDGPKTYSTSETDAPIDSPASGTMGTISLSATNALFSAGQRILIHQSRGAGVGSWEPNQIASYVPGLITTANPLTTTYTSTGDSRAQVVVAPEYTDLMVNAAVTVAAKAWDGSTGGILPMYVSGTATIFGAISATSRGFRGGVIQGGANTVANTAEGSQQDSHPSTSNSNQEGSAGLGDKNFTAASGAGGGGGANASAGGQGWAGGDQPGPLGGLPGGTSIPLSTTFGGGGASGSNGNSAGAGVGGTGGGFIFISASTLSIVGAVTANGQTGGDAAPGPVTSTSAGGGAAGGSIKLIAGSATLGTALVTASGGNGGSTGRGPEGGAGGIAPGGNGYIDGGGAAGGNGRIGIEYCGSLSGSTSPSAGVTLTDEDADAIGDCVDVCAQDSANDADNDGLCAGGEFMPPKTGANDNCPTMANPLQEDFDGDARGDACDPDDDNDEVFDMDEGPCGADPLDAGKQPERLDTPGDDDGDTLVNEVLPAGSSGFDCDGDGWKGNQENLIFGDAPSTARDQDPCGNNGWAADMDPDNKLNIGDINSFTTPNRPNASHPYSDGHGAFNKFGHPLDDANNGTGLPPPDGIIDPLMARWNLDTPPHLAGTTIDIGDLNAVNPGVAASTARPPMFGGLPAFFTNGGQCPYPP